MSFLAALSDFQKQKHREEVTFFVRI